MACTEPNNSRNAPHATAFCRLLIVLAAVAPVGWSVGAAGQALESRGYRPVDQRVEDIDPLQVSLRHQVSGLDETGERVSVFRPADQTGGRLYYVQRGVVAEYDRSQYGITGRGELLQMIPPNTVFHLSLPASSEASAASSEQPESINPYQVNGLVDGRPVPASRSAAVGADGRAVVGDTHRRLDDWQIFARISRQQRAALIDSLASAP